MAENADTAVHVTEDGLPVRDGVGILLVNGRGDVLLARRRKADNPAYPWQLPQGRRDPTCELHFDALRVLEKRTGCLRQNVKLKCSLGLTTQYDLPDKYRKPDCGARRHEWVVLDYTARGLPDLTLTSDDKFTELRWVSPTTAADLAESFRRATIQHVMRAWQNWLAQEYQKSRAS